MILRFLRPFGIVIAAVLAFALVSGAIYQADHHNSIPWWGWLIRLGLVLVVVVLLRFARPLLPSQRRKRCPDCAERVKAGARVCKHCGHCWPVPS